MRALLLACESANSALPGVDQIVSPAKGSTSGSAGMGAVVEARSALAHDPNGEGVFARRVDELLRTRELLEHAQVHQRNAAVVPRERARPRVRVERIVGRDAAEPAELFRDRRRLLAEQRRERADRDAARRAAAPRSPWLALVSFALLEIARAPLGRDLVRGRCGGVAGAPARDECSS